MRIAIAGLSAFVTLAAQDLQEVRVSSRPYTTFRLHSETNQVQVNVVVRDRTGRAISGLKQSDFQILDEGKPRDIVSFSVESQPGSSVAATGADAARTPPAAPRKLRFIAMFFDDLSTPAADLSFTKNAAQRLVAEGLSPADRVAVFTSSAGRITAGYTSDKKQLTEAIGRVQEHSRFTQLDTCPRMTPYDAYKIAIQMDEAAIHAATVEMSVCTQGLPTATAGPRLAGKVNRLSPVRSEIVGQAERMWDQVRVNSQNALAAISNALGELYRLPDTGTPGSRVLLLVSSGFVTGTLERERDLVVNQALRAGVVVNSLDSKGLFATLPGRPFGDGEQTAGTPIEVYVQETMDAVDRVDAQSIILADLAASTGGLYFHHNNGFSEGFRELGGAPETTYVLGFRPDEAALDDKYHKLKVRLTASNSDSIQARPGYFATSPAMEDAAEVSDKLDQQVTGSETLKDFPAEADYNPGAKLENGRTPLHIRMHVDIKGLEFPEREGRRLQKLTFVFALLDKDGAVVAAREGFMEFALTPAKFESMMQSGVSGVLTWMRRQGSISCEPSRLKA